MRESVHDELTALRGDFAELAKALNSHVADHSARVAVLEHRLTEADAEISELKTAGKTSTATRVSVGIALLSAGLAWVPDIISAIGK
ncbi:hypothetical protein [Amycolatopsis anabasis]|uniref:hypothetical protein n=1 Tax=Amycolatopsis anabasis TaxID=1840409 RepID=UPI00131AB8DF|nr:hypothetical protein [Amycolatopsis anabasis]